MEDKTTNSGEHSFKVNFFFIVLDTVISSLKKIFELTENYSESFEFLFDIQSMQNFADKEKLKKSCKHLRIIVSEGEDCNVNGNEFLRNCKFSQKC